MTITEVVRKAAAELEIYGFEGTTRDALLEIRKAVDEILVAERAAEEERLKSEVAELQKQLAERQAGLASLAAEAAPKPPRSKRSDAGKPRKKPVAASGEMAEGA